MFRISKTHFFPKINFLFASQSKFDLWNIFFEKRKDLYIFAFLHSLKFFL